MIFRSKATQHLLILVFFFCSLSVFTQIIETHEFGATNVQWYLYSDGKTWEFTAENDMTIASIEVKSVLASVSSTTLHIEVSIESNLLAHWDQYLNDNQYKPYYYSKSLRYFLAKGDKIVYKVYGNSSLTYSGGILGINYIKLIGNDAEEYDLHFTSLADMNYAKYAAGYTYDGNYIYSIGGGLGEYPWKSTSVEKYDLAFNTWTEIVTNLIPRRYCSAEFIASQNKIYIFNGDTYSSSTYTDTVEIVNVQNGELSYCVSNPYPIEYGGSAVWNDKIYVFGGSNAAGYSNRLYEYDPIIDSWTRLPDMQESKQTNGEIVNGVLYVFGGYSGSSSRRIDAYNIQNETWSILGEMPVGISTHATAVINNDIWLVGSYDDIRFLAVYNTVTNSFTQIKSDMIGRRHCGAYIVGNHLYSFGGNQASDDATILKSLEFADISNINTSIWDYEGPYLLNSNNYPNPFSESTTIQFALSEAEQTSIRVYNQLGVEVEMLLNKYMLPGEHKIMFQGLNLPAGLYFYKIQSGKYAVVRSMLLVKD